MRRGAWGGAVVLGFLVGGYGLAWWTATPEVGVAADGARLERMQQSPQWDGAAFTNPLPRVDGDAWETLRKELSGGDVVQTPGAPLPVVERAGAELQALPESGLRVTWLGHSTLLVELDGARVLVDPVWGERVSPWTRVGPARFHVPPLPLDALPPLDAVVISHDHYDHLDLPTVRALADRPLRWLVPLGIGAHLEHWGVPRERITELDWWDEVMLGDVRITATPARHFSGRWLTRMRSTLWAGWALRGPEHAVFYSGDTALFPELADIGERLGPFDLTMLDSGAYDGTWTDVHLGPEQVVVAHRMVRGRVLLPVHWGTFDLGNHAWTEPVERVRRAAARWDIDVRTPRPGESVELDDPRSTEVWWPTVPTASLETDPVWSTSVDGVLDQWWGPR